ncbi:hypothetical protein PPL_01177 [Heterostelium album PN500]|uniref:Uncharacterized protein n=1 Tax=Heterostelium pallidum (strain ATCC 26659 / Pp 5 / PN500) TaxID=670386 RepID=D3AYB7_HETP5|nr:hypothetical protein PPL_01177 [Heterostelium album PN500]EFA85944.1 hypothetical protein PPL_01177 [Heterostelium album PN500]|eukprot:XP_020438050.1 hypothetical protein PPL_01177 [Heterostelium album PN500]
MKLDLKGKRRNKMNQVHQVHQHLHKHHSDKHHPSMSSSTITTTVMIDDNDKHDNNTNNNNITSSITVPKKKIKKIEKEQQFSFNNSKAFKFKINPWSDSTKSAFAVILYGSVSLCQTIFNKKVMTTYNFEASNLMPLSVCYVCTKAFGCSHYFGDGVSDIE